ncbi:MAG: prepilin-type N-terminal cleavage/methylation domain-containing protein [Bacillota bacterium]
MFENEQGLTLAEVLVAAVILGIAALGLFGAFDTGRRLDVTARYDAAAVNRAQELLEQQRAVPYTSLAPVPTRTLDPADQILGPDARFCIALGNENASAGCNYKTVTVSVYYSVPLGTMAHTVARQIDLTMERSSLETAL